MLHLSDSIKLLDYSVSFITLTATLLGFLSYTLVIVLYRLYFHPLAAIPGPFLARVTDWYNVVVAWGGNRHLDFYKLHQQYGPVVRYGPSRVSINTASGLSEIYGSRSNVQKSDHYSIFNHYFKEPCVLTTLTHKEHAPKRKIVSQAFSDSAIQAMEEHTLVNIRMFCDHLKSSKHDTPWSTPFNISEWTNFLTFDIMSTLCFSTSYGMLNSTEQHWIIPLLQKATQGLNVVGHMQWIARIGLDKLIFRKLAAANDRFQALSRKMAINRYNMQDDTKLKDAFYFLQKARDPVTGASLTREQLIAETALLIVAGSDTTSTAMTSTMFYLLQNPACLSKLQDEIRTKFSDTEQIRSGAVLSSCTYLRACIEEGLRMTPGVSGLLPREVLPGGLTIDGTVFPAGVDLGVPIYAIHHNEQYYPQPFNYIPERWLADASSPETSLQNPAAVALARSAFCPFSLGAWSCIGKGMAYKEIMITIARLVWIFDWRIAPGTPTGGGDPSKAPETLRHRPDELQGRDLFVLVVDGPVVQFRERAEVAEKI